MGVWLRICLVACGILDAIWVLHRLFACVVNKVLNYPWCCWISYIIELYCSLGGLFGR